MPRMCMIVGFIVELVLNAVTLAAESGVTIVSVLTAAATVLGATWHGLSVLRSRFAAPDSLWE